MPGGRAGLTLTPARRALSTKAFTASRSLTRGDRSTPLATSTPHGLTVRTATATLAGVKPPARITLRVRARPVTSEKSTVRPVPPRAPGTLESIRSNPLKLSARVTSAAAPTRSALNA